LQSKKIIIKIVGLLIFISSPILLNASHIVGGKISYRFLGVNKYEIKLTIYRNCADLYDFDNPAPLTIFDNSTNLIVSNHQLTLYHRDTIHPNNPDPCFIPPAGICVEEGYYLDTVLLPTNTSGYTVTYQRCCHNASILNIASPFTNGTTITANIPPQINNSATFLNSPPIYICVNDTFNYSFASVDIDGDSLIYQMCTPLSGITNSNPQPNPSLSPPYLPLNWITPYTATNPITTSSGLNFNSANGSINFIPTIQGQYAVGICVDEYRNGILLNTNRLEIQFNVVACYLVSSIPTATNLCEGLTINFQNGSTNATSYLWNFGDNTTFADTSNILTPTYSFATFGTYTVSLVAINTNYGTCKDTTIKVINVNPLLAPTLLPNYSACYNNNLINFNIGGSFHSSATFNWNLGSNAIPINPSVSNPNIHFDTINQHISVLVSQFGCADTLYSVVSFTNPVALFNVNNDLNCNGLTLYFNSGYSLNANSYKWDFGDITSSTDTSSQISPLPSYTYPTSGIYTVTLIAYDGSCSDTLKLPINVQALLAVNPEPNLITQCLKNNSFNFNANGIYGTNTMFSWNFMGANPLTSNQENPQNIHFLNTGTYKVILNVYENGCTVQDFVFIKVLPSPTAHFTASDTIGCQPLKINFTNQSISIIPFTSNWKTENTNYNTLNNTHTFYNSGLYSIYLTVKDTNNCTDTTKKINYINVLPKPTALANANPNVTDILNPTINFIDATLNTYTTYFDFGDNTISNQILNYHTYENIGTYNYQLIVINNFGCTDTTNGTILINPINALYVPNSFTPNNDNLNDTFFPVIPYYKNATMQIFNRWGVLIYNTNDIQSGWDGTYKNSKLPNDVYTYKIDVEFLDSTTKTQTGNVTLIR
jgi:gliding motility-associated-like protein